MKERYTFADLLGIMEKLRSPDGCPWDRAQTHQSIKKHMVEEAYELVEAIDSGDPKKMADESGDLLLQVVFHAAIAKDGGEYDMNDVTDAICKKMMHRHPHIFEGQEAVDWDEIKRRDRAQETIADELKGISPYLPALMRAEKIQKKIAKAGFAPDEISGDTELDLGQQLYALVSRSREWGLDPELALNRYLNHVIATLEESEKTKENL